jgi:hypothetical protein
MLTQPFCGEIYGGGQGAKAAFRISDVAGQREPGPVEGLTHHAEVPVVQDNILVLPPSWLVVR